MAKVTIRINSDVEEYGVLVRDNLQLIAEAHEGYCSYILGDLDKMEGYHQQMLWEAVKLLTIISELPRSLEIQSDN
jgi:hypothetical protein